MDALLASYGSESEPESGEDSPPPTVTNNSSIKIKKEPNPLPPPPLDLLQPPNYIPIGFSGTSQGVRIRGFPHVEGNYALHVFIPVRIPITGRKLLANFVKKVASSVPDLYVVDVDIALSELCKDDQKLEQILLDREFHISLGRTLPIQVHQIDSIAAMLRQKLQSQKGFWIEFNKWEVFVNDDLTRSFLSLEVTGGGLSEICKQIQIVNDIYRLHGLPEFYETGRKLRIQEKDEGHEAFKIQELIPDCTWLIMRHQPAPSLSSQWHQELAGTNGKRSGWKVGLDCLFCLQETFG